MTYQGPRSSIKYIDYIEDPRFEFHLKILNDGVIQPVYFMAVLNYGSIHGMGAERSQDWGRYEVVRLIWNRKKIDLSEFQPIGPDDSEFDDEEWETEK